MQHAWCIFNLKCRYFQCLTSLGGKKTSLFFSVSHKIFNVSNYRGPWLTPSCEIRRCFGVRDKREVWCLAWRNHLLLMKKKKNEEISFLSVVYTVLRLVLSTISYILKHHVSRAIMRHDPFPIIIIIIISNRLLTPHSYLDLSTGGAD